MKSIIKQQADDEDWKKLIGWIVDYGFVIMYLNYDKEELGKNRIRSLDHFRSQDYLQKISQEVTNFP